MLSVMNDNVYLDSEIKGFDKNDNRYSEDNRHKCVDDDVVVDSSSDVIGNGETRVGDLNLGGTVDRMDVDGQVDKSEDFVSGGQMDVDAKVEKREEFGSVNKMSAGAGAKGTKMEEFNGASSRLELDDGVVRETDILNDVGKGKNDETKERPGKRFEKSCVGNGGSGMVEKVGGYEIGDMVWGKVKSHPWWPGQIYNEELASPAVRKTKTAEGCLLVAFFGDCSFGWFYPTELIPFDSSYAEKSQQPSSRIFVKAIEEAVDEASRRCSLGLACRCRNAYSFRPTTVPGYLSVDFGDHENGTIYSVDQIRRSRDDFQPIKMLNFVNQLALSPVNVEHKAIDFVKNKATALAYRKAVYEEFDETYAQAFGYESERPHVQTQNVNQPPKAATPAPLSGPLVIAEVLHKGKGSAKSRKSKDHGEKDQFLFKRRDEPNGLKASVEINRGKAASSKQPVYEEGSLSTAATEHAIQKKSAPVSTKHKFSAKHHRKESSARDKVSDPRQKTSGKGGMTTGKHSSMQFSHGGSPMNLINSTDGTVVGKTPSQLSHSHEPNASLINEKDVRREIGKSSKFEVGVGLEGINTADSADDKPCPIKLVESFEPSSSQAAKTKLLGEQGQGQVGCVAHPPGTDSEKSQIEGRYLKNGIPKKVKVRKQPTEGLNGENSAVSIKKKRKKEILSSKNMKMPLSGEKVEAAVGNIDKLPVHGAISSRENLQLEPHIKEDKVLIETNLAHKMSPVETTELELLQLLHSLQSLAREFTLGSSSSTTFVRQAFLKYRSLVFEKSLAILPDADSEPADLHSSDHAAVNKTLDIPAADVRERLAVKPHRQVVRPDDPSKGGRKRGPSDRQEEIVAKKKKKLSDMKVLTSEKKTTQKISVIQRADGIKEASQLTMKSIKPAPLKKPEPSSRTSDPLMLVMKFPPQGTLPSIMELKARFARFGQLDHSATRIFWKTSTCRLVYRHRADAESACKHVSSCSNLFGNTDVKCYTREVEIASSVNEPGRAQKEDTLMGTSQLRDSVEQRPATSLPSRTLQQPGGQLRSILKKSNGDDAGATNGGGKKTRVKFILGEEETNRAGEQSMIGNKNMNNNVVFVDGGTSSSTSHHGMDINSKNIVVPPPPLPMLPIATTVQYQKPPNYMHHTELAPRNTHNFNVVVSQPMTPIPPKIDISQQMMGLLIKCNDVVNKLTDILGYLPLHPL